MGVNIPRHSIGIEVRDHDGKIDKLNFKRAEALVLEMEKYTAWPPKKEAAEPDGLSLADAYTKWIGRYEKGSTTQVAYACVERVLLEPLALQGVTLVKEVTGEHLDALQRSWKAREGAKGNRKLNTINTWRRYTANLFNYCVNYHGLARNPWKAVERPTKGIKPTRREIMAFKRKDKGVATLPLDRKGNANWLLIQANVAAFVRGELPGQIQYKANPMFRFATTFFAILWLMYETGLRRSDATIFRPDKIQTTQHGGSYTCPQFKTGDDVTVFLPAPLVEALRALPLLPWRGTATDYTDFTGEPFTPGAGIFPFYDGTLDTYENYMESYLNTPLRDLGRLLFGEHSPSLRPHRFRDSFAVNMLNLGLSLQDVQLMLGHSMLATTEKYYRPYVLGVQEAVENRQAAARQAALFAEAQKAAKVDPIFGDAAYDALSVN
jgi:integrase